MNWRAVGAIMRKDLRVVVQNKGVVLPIILLSSLVGAIIGSVWLATQGRDRATPIPFGPYLAIAGWIVFFWGPQIIDAYLRFAGLK